MMVLIAANILMYVYLYISDASKFLLVTSNTTVVSINFISIYIVFYLSYKAGNLKL